jgi:hypothetical protein
MAPQDVLFDRFELPFEEVDSSLQVGQLIMSKEDVRDYPPNEVKNSHVSVPCLS